MATPTRVAPKTQYALADIRYQCEQARRRWSKLLEMAEKRIDPAMALYIAGIRDNIAEIDRLAADAANGDYNERR